MNLFIRFVVPVLFICFFGQICSSESLIQSRSEQPVKIKANELSADGTGKTATFSGSVVAKQGDLTILCDRLQVLYGDKEQEISKIEAFGNVRIIQGNRRGEAGRARYDSRSGTIIMEENPSVSQGDDIVTGKTITFYLDAQKSVVTGGQDRRVEAVIHPKGKGVNVGNKP